MFAAAVLELTRRLEVGCVVDVGAGNGEFLRHLQVLDPSLELIGVELRPRPADLPAEVQWHDGVPRRVDGLVIANEVVDNVTCEVVEVDDRGTIRLVEVEPATGAERLGDIPSPDALAWLEQWWRLDVAGSRAEVGLSREQWWDDICARLRSGACLAIDYGHRSAERPPLGSLASYRAGRRVPVAYDGDRDITADVAVDALRHRVGGGLRRQSECLAALGIQATRPPIQLATSDPPAYVRALSQVGEVAELTASPGLGDFWWLLTGPGGLDVDMGA